MPRSPMRTACSTRLAPSPGTSPAAPSRGRRPPAASSAPGSFAFVQDLPAPARGPSRPAGARPARSPSPPRPASTSVAVLDRLVRRERRPAATLVGDDAGSARTARRLPGPAPAKLTLLTSPLVPLDMMPTNGGSRPRRPEQLGRCARRTRRSSRPTAARRRRRSAASSWPAGRSAGRPSPAPTGADTSGSIGPAGSARPACLVAGVHLAPGRSCRRTGRRRWLPGFIFQRRLNTCVGSLPTAQPIFAGSRCLSASNTLNE